MSLRNLNATELIPAVVSSWHNLISSLYASGARNFLVLTVPPTQRTPYIRSFGADMVANVEANIALYTTLQNDAFASLSTQYPDASFVKFDTHPLFDAVLDTPTTFGFTVADRSASVYWNQHNPEADSQLGDAPLREYVWADDYHPSWPVHKLLAEAVAEVRRAPPSSNWCLFVVFFSLFPTQPRPPFPSLTTA
jgi:phospholipase/lecithinase/hemolysin